MENLLEAIKPTADNVTIGYNLLWAFFALFLAVVCFFIARKQPSKTDVYYFMVGGIFDGIGTFVHRMYWTCWRYFKGTGHPDIAQYFVNYGHIISISVFVIVGGYIIHLRPVFRSYLGSAWAPIILGISFLLFVGGYLSIPIGLYLGL